MSRGTNPGELVLRRSSWLVSLDRHGNAGTRLGNTSLFRKGCSCLPHPAPVSKT